MDNVNLPCPRSWAELSQEQLRYVFFLLATFADAMVVKTYMFIRFADIDVLDKNRFGWKCAYRPDGKLRRRVFYLQPWQIHSFLSQLSWVDSIETMDNRLDVVCGLKAVHPLLQEDADTKRIISFGEYLCMERHYQHFIATQREESVDMLASFLYRRPDFSRPDEITLTPAERLATIAWYTRIKYVMSHAFKHLFRRADCDADTSDVTILDSINIQIRALTDGDVTKEKEVKSVDCWRALTELNAKARETEELKNMMKRK